jgi:hypothetical protein
VDERTAQFIITVADVLEGARLASLPVVARVRDEDVVGIPETVASASGAEEVDDTGRAKRVAIDGVVVDLEDIEQISLRRP